MQSRVPIGPPLRHIDFNGGWEWNSRVWLADFEYQVWPGFTFGSLHPNGVSAGISFQVLGSSRTKMSK